MNERAVAHIDLAAFGHNLRQLRNKAPHSAILAMVKANGYGHGLLRTALALKAVDGFGVATLMEAIQLRKAGVDKPIFLMSGFYDAEELALTAYYGLTSIIHSEYQLQILEQTRLDASVEVWLLIDTGMHRLGCTLREAIAFHQRLTECVNVRKPIGLMSHFVAAENAADNRTLHQLTDFTQVTVNLPGPKSLANSAGMFFWPQTHYDWVRPGIALYGVNPNPQSVGAEFHLKPVMTLTSRLIALHTVNQGETVGYNGTWRCPQAMLVGVVSIGYGDGYPRQAKSGTPVLVNQTICALIGRVSMDLIMVDLRAYPQAKIGDKVTLWGQGLPIEQVATFTDTTPYQLLCNVSPRVTVVESIQAD